ncbi:probable G-protein coupled receptor No18 [Limulus polyphemus]|uniref:Probable G-protein coupled receptor No18 n=1 Tax=Limulus polyphemus TaxID=6850 RepID=A0ABM1BMR1_LIMPO|nr:probable G-protein coupled receptor No18 [Limulus polyphemus]
MSQASVITALSVLIVLTLVGNTLVIAAVATTRRMRTITNYFVVSLAVADLLVGLLVLPLAVIQEVHHSWPLGRVVCEFWISMDVLLCTASILNLCCISLDRYFAITSPMSYVVKRNSRLAVVMICGVWVMSALITCPPIFGWHDPGRQNATECAYNSNKGYVVYSALGSFYIPALVMVYVYWRIFAVARRRETVLTTEVKTSLQKGSGDNSDAPKLTYETEDDPMQPTSEEKNEVYALTEPFCNGKDQRTIYDKPAGNHTLPKSISMSSKSYLTRSACNRATNGSNFRITSRFSTTRWRDRSCSYRGVKSRSGVREDTVRRRQGYEQAAFQRERRVAKSLSVVVGGFIVCWLPFFTLYIIKPFCFDCHIPQILDSCLVWLGWVNSAINPFIYALNSNDYKKAFARLTIDKLRRRPRRRNRNINNFT